MTGNKRKHSDDPHNSGNGKKGRSGQGVEPRVDPTYGQRSAIPGLDDDTVFNDGDELDYTEDMNALNYLRSVRHEATGIPNLLVAPRATNEDNRAMYEDGVGDFRGRYEDGAYVAFSDTSLPPNEEDESFDPQVPYYDNILERYGFLRGQLQQKPPLNVVNRLRKDQPTHVEFLSRNVSRHWSYIMTNVDPTPGQVACMEKESVLRLLDLLTRDRLMKRGMNIGLCVSHWTWSLLARLPDRGELTSEEIGILRELGKKAVLVGTGLGQEKSWEAGLQEVEAGLNGQSSTPGEVSIYDNNSDEEGEVSEVVNDDEISLDLDLDLSSDLYPDDSTTQYLGLEGGEASLLDPEVSLTPSLHTDVADQLREEQNTSSLPDTSMDAPKEDEDLEAVKARLLKRLSTQQLEFSVNLEPEIIVEPKDQPTPKPIVDKELLKWNTKATVDMIITVAGEVYGQRDLLEFRSIWTSTM